MQILSIFELYLKQNNMNNTTQTSNRVTGLSVVNSSDYLLMFQAIEQKLNSINYSTDYFYCVSLRGNIMSLQGLFDSKFIKQLQLLFSEIQSQIDCNGYVDLYAYLDYGNIRPLRINFIFTN